MAIIIPGFGDEDKKVQPAPGDLPTPQPTTPTPTPAVAPDRRGQIASAYQQFLGRAPSESDYLSWMGNDSFAQGIANSPEAQAKAAGQNYTRSYTSMPGWDPNKLNDPNKSDPKYNYARAVQEWGPPQRGNLQPIVDYYNKKYGAQAKVTSPDHIDFGDGYGPVDVIKNSQTASPEPWWWPDSNNAGGTGQSATGGMTSTLPGQPMTKPLSTGQPSATSTTGAGPVSGGAVFSDPATTEWEGLLRQFVDKLNTPQQTWSPSQMELQQTQALDPLERQRQSYRQQQTEQLSRRGIVPGSGVYDSAMRDIDRQFQQMETQTRSGFATQAINREDQVFNNNETRAGNAVNTFRQIPQLADQRLATAQGTIQQNNPAQLLSLQSQMEQQQRQQQQYQDQQNQQFWAQLVDAISRAFA